MAREFIEATPLPPSSEPGQLPLQGTPSATNTNEKMAGSSPPSASLLKDSTPYQRNWKGRIRDWISKPSVQVLIALVVITAFSFTPAILSSLGGSGNSSEPSPGDYVLLLGDIFKFDWQNTQTVSVQWSLYGYGQYQSQISYAATDGHLLPNKPLDIYIDNASQPLFSYVPPPNDTSQINAASMYSFKTERDTVFCKPQYYVPDDCYSISASIFVIDRETNGSVPLQFLISDSGAGDFGGESIVLDTVTDFTRIVGDQLATTVVASYTLLVAITRSKRTREITYFIFSVNWLLSVCSIITTAFIFRRREKLRDAVALIPLTLILTIPTIRGLYPGNPPFGVYIDLVGFFPQMLSVSLCIVAMLFGFAVRYNNKARPEIELEGLQMGVLFNETVERVAAQRHLHVPS